jgi:hypothetical protein
MRHFSDESRDTLGYWIESCIVFLSMLARMGHGMGRNVVQAIHAWLEFMAIRPARACLVQYVVPVPPRPMPVPRRWAEPVPVPGALELVVREVPVPVPEGVPAPTGYGTQVPCEICGVDVAETPEPAPAPAKRGRKKPAQKTARRREKVTAQVVDVPAPAHMPDALTGMTVTQLRAICKAEGRRGYSSLKKRELIALLRS